MYLDVLYIPTYSLEKQQLKVAGASGGLYFLFRGDDANFTMIVCFSVPY